MNAIYDVISKTIITSVLVAGSLYFMKPNTGSTAIDQHAVSGCDVQSTHAITERQPLARVDGIPVLETVTVVADHVDQEVLTPRETLEAALAQADDVMLEQVCSQIKQLHLQMPYYTFAKSKAAK